MDITKYVYMKVWYYITNVPMYKIPIIRSFLNVYKSMCEYYLKSASSSGKAFSEQSSSHTSRVLFRKKTCIFQVRTHKVLIEEMTDRWETGNSDGLRSMIAPLSVLHLRGRIPPSKKQQTSEIYKTSFDISQRMQHFFAVMQRSKNP